MDNNEMQNSTNEPFENYEREELKSDDQFLEPEDQGYIKSEELSGIGGWLILVAIGRIIAPFIALASIFNDYLPAITGDQLDLLSKPGNDMYSQLWKPTIFFEFGSNIVILVGSIVLLFLFFGKKRIFPKAYISLIIFTVAFAIIDAILMSKIQSAISVNLNFKPGEQVIETIVIAAIWIPYVLKSVRVKNTFIR